MSELLLDRALKPTLVCGDAEAEGGQRRERVANVAQSELDHDCTPFVW